MRIHLSLFLALLLFAPGAYASPPKACLGGYAQFGRMLHFREAAGKIARLHRENRGVTFNPAHRGPLGGQAFIAVSIFPERSFVVEGRDLSEDIIDSFLNANQDLLDDPRISLGAWYDEKSNKTYLDVSLTLPARTKKEREAAIRVGKIFNQKAVFDLKDARVIDTGGDGTVSRKLPPESDRLGLVPPARLP